MIFRLSEILPFLLDPDALEPGTNAKSHLINDPKNTEILKNAARFYRFASRRGEERSIILIKKVVELNPTDHDAQAWLADMYFHQLDSAKRFGKPKSLEYTYSDAVLLKEQALKLVENKKEELQYMRNLPEYAFKAGAYDKAAFYAQKVIDELSKEKCTYGTDLHEAHTFYGLTALQRKDIDTARKELIESIPAASQRVFIGPYSPSTALAAKLLELGQKRIVIQYLNKIRNLWEGHQDLIDFWIFQIQRKGKTEFSKLL